MAWDWIEKGARRLQELGGEYKQHHALVERLVALEPAAAKEEITRAWLAMDDRARAGVKMSLAGPLRLRVDYRVFKLGSGALYSPAHRIYAGLNLKF